MEQKMERAVFNILILDLKGFFLRIFNSKVRRIKKYEKKNIKWKWIFKVGTNLAYKVKEF